MPTSKRPLLHFDEVSSTMDVIRECVQAGHSPWVIVTASTQSCGRGRRGAEWGNAGVSLLMSFLIPASTHFMDAQKVSLAVGVGVADVCDSLFDVPTIGLKFPNDVLLGGGKVGGILVENWMYSDAPYWVIGVGVNIASAPRVEGSQLPVAALDITVRPSSAEMASRIALQVDTLLDNAVTPGADLVTAWNQRFVKPQRRRHSTLGMVTILRLLDCENVVITREGGALAIVSGASLLPETQSV